MKTILFAAFVVLGLGASAVAAPVVFIVLTHEMVWADGVVDGDGEVEVALSVSPSGYIIQAPGGGRAVPKDYARVISAQEAAMTLIAQRNEAPVADAVTTSAKQVPRSLPSHTERREDGLLYGTDTLSANYGKVVPEDTAEYRAYAQEVLDEKADRRQQRADDRAAQQQAAAGAAQQQVSRPSLVQQMNDAQREGNRRELERKASELHERLQRLENQQRDRER